MFEPIERLQEQAQRHLSGQAGLGAPLVGYTYGFAPPELLRACGAVPVRLRDVGGYEAQQAGQQLTKGNTCTYCKAIVGGVATALWDRLSLLVGDGLCEALRRACEVWDVRFNRRVYTLSVPRVGNGEALKHYVAELGALQQAVCALTGWAFNKERLRLEIVRSNGVRALLRQINRYRLEDPARLAASELWAIAAAAELLPPERAVVLLNLMQAQLEVRTPLKHPRKRLLLLGSFLAQDDRALVDLIEQNGGQIVCDALPEGQGAFWHDVPAGDPLQALATHALEDSWHIQRPHRALLGFLASQAKAAQLDGIVYKTLEFCDPWSLQAKRIKMQVNMPCLHVDGDYAPAHRQQLRTRVEAFLEML